MFDDVTLSVKNYDELLISWANQTVKEGLIFDAGKSQYTQSTDVENARSILMNTYGWIIIDAGAVNE